MVILSPADSPVEPLGLSAEFVSSVGPQAVAVRASAAANEAIATAEELLRRTLLPRRVVNGGRMARMSGSPWDFGTVLN